jgi:hypothetical protein
MKVVIGLFFVAVAGASGVTLRLGLESDAGEILAKGIDFAGVVKVESQSGNLGSGVFLNGDWVLTAGHVVEGSNGAVVRVGGSEYQVSEIVQNPGWRANPSVGLEQGNDLALLRLESAVGGVPEIPLWKGGGGAPFLGMMAGYGSGGNGLLGSYLPQGNLRAGLNVVDRFLRVGTGGLWVTDFDSGASRHNSLNEATVDLRYFDISGPPLLSEAVFGNGMMASSAGFDGLSLQFGAPFPEGTTARGDSGGPLFIYSGERARWELAGVTSFGENPLYPAGFNRFDSRYGDLSFYTDVSGQQDWLDSVMVPEPSTSVLMFMGLLFLIRRRTSGCYRAVGESGAGSILKQYPPVHPETAGDSVFEIGRFEIENDRADCIQYPRAEPICFKKPGRKTTGLAPRASS